MILSLADSPGCAQLFYIFRKSLTQVNSFITHNEFPKKTPPHLSNIKQLNKII